LQGGKECFDADTGKDSTREIREYFIPDFGNWKDHDLYQEAFQRLVSDLKAPTQRRSKEFHKPVVTSDLAHSPQFVASLPRQRQ